MVAGGWIESLFIATQLAKYEKGSMVVDRLADQKYTLENLIEFIKKYNSDPNVKKVQDDFQALFDIYNQLSETDVTSKSTKKSDKKILEGGKNLSMTEEQFKNIKEKIASIRNSYTQVK
jgi:hypothetical protein